MKLHNAACIFIALIFIFTLSGCSTKTAPEAETLAPGYHKAADLVQGGTLNEVGDLNAKSLSVSTSVMDGTSETALEFEFISGS